MSFKAPAKGIAVRIGRIGATLGALALLGGPVSASGPADATRATPGVQASARDHYEAGRRAKKSDERRAHFAQGMQRAQAILAGAPDDPAGLFWLAVNMGSEALERGKMSALPVVPRMEKLLLRLFKIAPAFESAGAARVLGRLYHQAPAVISVGSNDKARTFLNKALELAPEHPGNLAFAADFFLAVDDDEKRARGLAQRCLAILDKADHGQDEREWRAIANEVVEDSD